MKKLLLIVFAAIAFAACTNDSIEEQVAVQHDAPESITVSFEGDDTRIQLNEAQKTVWTNGDQVSVFYFSDANQLWQYNGETGSRTANLKRVNAGEPTAQTTYNVVAYPFNEDYFLNTRTGALHATLPATQHYLKDSYGVGDNLMVAQSEFTQFSLKSVCGWLKLQLTGDGEVVKSITFKGNNGEQVAGLIYVDTATAEATLASEMGSSDDNNAGGNLIFDDTILTEVTLDCGEGVALGKEATAFYIALPPQTFEQGFTVEIEDIEGYIMEQSTDKALTIERNHIQPMAAFEFINPNPPTQSAPASNQIWYTSSDGDVVTPYYSHVFGANIISNKYNNGMGVITFDGDVTTIGNYAFAYCTSLTSVNIPDSVTTIGHYAFAYCYSLTSVNIPDSVTKIGICAFDNCDSLTSVNIPDSVTTIGDGAFYYCERLICVNIPDSVTTIGDHAFRDCTSLSSVNIPDSVTTIGYTAFYDCTSLISVTIGDSVTSIGEGAFAVCRSLKEFKGKYATEDGRSLIVDNTIIAYANASGTTYTIPDSVTAIGNCAFLSCDSLTIVNIPDSVTTIGDSAFEDCSSLTSVYCKATTPPSLDWNVFGNNGSGRKIYVPTESVEAYKSAECWSDYASDIVGYDFENGEIVEMQPNNEIWYTSLDGDVITPYDTDVFGTTITSNTYSDGKGVITFDSDVTRIGDDAFAERTSLTSVTIPDSVTLIGNGAFSSCTSLTSVLIPDSVTTIGNYAFYNCYSLTSVTIGDSVTTIGNYAFCYCTSLTSVTIGDSVTTIGNEAFLYCKSLTEFNGKFAEDNGRILVIDGSLVVFAPAGLTEYSIPDSVTTIGKKAFYYCENLTSVTIHDSVTTIGEEAFYGCKSLTSVTIPDSVTMIGGFAFSSCESLTSVYCKAITPPVLGYKIFGYNGNSRNIYVPTESVEAYKSATYWSDYASAIVGYDF